MNIRNILDAKAPAASNPPPPARVALANVIKALAKERAEAGQAVRRVDGLKERINAAAEAEQRLHAVLAAQNDPAEFDRLVARDTEIRAGALARGALVHAERALAVALQNVERLERAYEDQLAECLALEADALAERYGATFKTLCEIRNHLLGFAQGLPRGDFVPLNPIVAPNFDLRKGAPLNDLRHVPDDNIITRLAAPWRDFSAALRSDPFAVADDFGVKK